MKNILFTLIALAMCIVFSDMAIAQSSQPVLESRSSGAEELRKTEGESSVEMSLKDLDAAKAQILADIANEQEHILSITTDIEKGTYILVMDEPNLTNAKLEGFMNSLIWHKENPTITE